MRLNRFKNSSSITRRLCLILIILILASLLFLSAVAIHKEIDVTEFNEKLTIPANKYKAIDISFQEGKKLEILYTVQVKQSLPIDIWFVNEDNYLLLTNGAQFLYYIDGTEQKISYAKKVVTLTENDIYKLVMTNYYNNQTVDVDVIGEIRDNQAKSEETSLEYLSILLYYLIIILIVFAVIIIFIGFKIRKYKQAEANKTNIKSTKNTKTNKTKKDKVKNKPKGSSKKNIGRKLKETKTKPISNSQSYCGYCGKPADTPFCKHCGRKV